MVTLQILVLSFLVRVRVSQLHHSGILLKSKIGIWCNGNTTDSGPVIPGSSPGIPTHTVRHLSVMEGVFLFIGILFYGVFITINPRAFALGFIVFICSLHQ